jgi:hypothetical protein
MIQLQDVAAVLQQYSSRYRFLDVLASEIEDLALAPWRAAGAGQDVTQIPVPMRAQHLGQGVLRFSLEPRATDLVGSAMAGAAVGAALGASTKRDGNALTGMLLGMLVGAIVGDATRMNRVMALRFDATESKWTVYDGPLLNVAKDQLAPARA